ncbi:hypothetical protein D3C80_1566170 [compost metagenome]
MIAIQVAQATLPAQAVVPAQVHACFQQPLAQGTVEGQRAIVIEQAAHPHTAPCGLLQRCDDRFGAGASLDQIQFEVDLELGARDRLKHAREEFGAVDQQFELVAIPPGEDRPRHVSGR